MQKITFIEQDVAQLNDRKPKESVVANTLSTYKNLYTEL